jgi:hypothetical protein
MMVVSGVISHHGRRPCIFTIPLEMKERGWKPPHRALNKSNRNKFFDDILFNIPLSYELTSSSFPLPNLDHPHQNILSYAYPFFTAFALRYVQATEYAKN